MLLLLLICVGYSTTLPPFIACGESTSNMMSSNNGVVWNSAGASPFTTACYGIKYFPLVSKYIALGAGGNTIASTIDGINWIGHGSTVFTTQGNDIAYSTTQNIYIAVGAGTNTLANSTDGITWSGQGTSIFSVAGRGVSWSILSGAGRFVAVGGVTNTIAYSTDGIIWATTGPGLFSSASGVYLELGLAIAVGGGTNRIATGPDGTTWTGNNGTVFYSNQGMFVTKGNGTYLGGGSGTTNLMIISLDGVNWKQIPGSSGCGSTFDAVYNTALGIWVSVGTGLGNLCWTNDANGTWNQVAGVFSIGGYAVATANNVVIPTTVTSTTTIFTPITTPPISNNTIIDSVFLSPFITIVFIDGSAQIPQNETVLNITNQIITITDSLAVVGNWRLKSTASVNVTNEITLQNVTYFEPGAVIQSDKLTIATSATLIIETNQLGNFVVARYRSAPSQFSSVITNNQCIDATPSYSSSTLAVTLTQTPNCDAGNVVNTNEFPLGAIVGIAVGCLVLATVAIIIIHLLIRKNRNKLDEVNRQRLKDEQINDLGRGSSTDTMLKPNPHYLNSKV